MTKGAIPLPTAAAHARRLAMTLYDGADALTRVEIAGSIRRLKPTVGDIEIVAEIDPEREFGATARIAHTLGSVGVHRAGPAARADGVHVRAPWGDRYMKGEWEPELGVHVQVDLFVVRPPAEWGVVYLIRTGSAEFSQAVVTRLHRYGLRSEDGRIVDPMGRTVPCPDEEKFFRLAGLPQIPPEDRDMGNARTAERFR